jgi:predicted NBD/HSP70 family sugar kinase
VSALALVFDVGGTHIRAGAYSLTERRLVRTARETLDSGRSPPTEQDPSGGGLFPRLGAMGRVVLAGNSPEVVVIAFPGPIDRWGNPLAAPTIWGSTQERHLPIKDLLQAQWPDKPLLVLNDVTAAGFRYLSHPDESLCIVTVSSGIGHKVFVHGQPVVGPTGRGGEIGHLQVDFSPDAPMCDCGHRGHLGALASGRASHYQVLRLAGEDPSGFSASLLALQSGSDPSLIRNEHVVTAFHQGDAWTERVIRRMADALGFALAAIHLTVGVERFILIGGFALALGQRYRSLTAAAAARCGWNLGLDWDAVLELGQADDDAGLIGASQVAVMHYEKTRGASRVVRAG